MNQSNKITDRHCAGGDDSNSFSLVTRPGSDKAELVTMVELDYESSHKKYDLVVRAASPPLRTDAHVEILVTDVNDNAPLLHDFQVTQLLRRIQLVLGAGVDRSVH